jgi:hypothetical protein
MVENESSNPLEAALEEAVSNQKALWRAAWPILATLTAGVVITVGRESSPEGART